MKIIAIVGPTASGKTDISLKLAKRINGEIVNADSMLFYKELFIGTDKPKKDKYKKYYYVDGIRHYLIDFLSPKKSYSIDSYIKESKKIIGDIVNRGKVPIIVGGSALYTDAIIYDYKLSGILPDKKLRKNLSAKNLDELLSILKNNSLVSYKIVDKQNKRRVIRAIELSLSGKSISRDKKELSRNILFLGVDKKREDVKKSINKRVALMVNKGLVTEVKRLIKKYPKKSPAFLGIGYKEVISYLKGNYSIEQAIERIEINTRRLAKKQMTWYKRDKNIVWITSYREALKKSLEFIN